MNIRTFTAQNMTDALALVKQELGRHAVVLHTRSIKRGGILGIGARTLIEVTAADGREVARQRQQKQGESPRARVLRQAAEARSSVAVPTPAEQQTAGDLIRRTYQAARTQFDPAASATASVAVTEPPPRFDTTPPPQVAVSPPTPSVTEDAQRVAKELQAVRHLVEQVMQNQQVTQTLVVSPPAEVLPDPLVEFYGTLIEQEVGTQLADELVRGIDLDTVDDPAEALRREIADRLLIDDQAGKPIDSQTGRPHVVALVGPTGVGKTTTLAKLAAMYKLKQNKTVGLITADTYRIAAVEQLRTYAQIIDLPLEIVANAQQLQAAMHKLGHCDVIMIDTAGRSQRNSDRLTELQELLKVAEPDETHLVLSATASQRVLMQIVDRFEAVQTDRLIFTKLDEAVTYGVLFNVAQRVGKPLSYVTTGQEVPHQIEACNPQQLARWLVGKEMVEA